MATRSKARKAAPRKPRDSYKGIPKDAHMTVTAILAMERKRGMKATPSSVYREILARRAQDKKEVAAAQDKRLAENLRKRSLEALQPALSKLLHAVDLATSIEEDKQDYLAPFIVGHCIRLIVSEVGEEIEQSLCDLGVIPEGNSSFVGTLKCRMPKAAQVAHG